MGRLAGSINPRGLSEFLAGQFGAPILASFHFTLRSFSERTMLVAIRDTHRLTSAFTRLSMKAKE